MGDIGLFRQGWKWLQSRKQVFVGSRAAVSCAREKVAFLADRHWPVVYSWFVSVGRLLCMLALHWKECSVEGLRSLLTFGSAALFVILWSFFLSLTSTTSLVYVLVCLATSGTSVCYLGYTPGLFIVGLFGILIMWIYGYFWITGMLLIACGYVFSLNHARILILMATTYAVYYVYAHIGWHGAVLSLNLSFYSNDILNKLLKVCDSNDEATNFEKPMEPEPVMDNFSCDSEFSSPLDETEYVASSKSPCTTPSPSSVSKVQKDASPSKVVKTDSTSLDEMKRIISSPNYYEVLGFFRNKHIDPKILKKEYHKKVLLVHPDKNMGNSLACESFKKLQCAYEVLSDVTKKKDYDEQLRKEESGRLCNRSPGTSQQAGVEYRSEESRRIECTKCANSHIWICTNRSKARARWCQSCSQYHQAKDGDGWVENGCTTVIMTPQKVEIPRAFVCAESKIFDVSEWASCQGVTCKPNTHGPSFQVNMVGLDRTGLRSNPSRYPWGLDAEMIVEDEDFELWLQQALASGVFSETPKRRKSWSPFKINQKGMKPWRRSP